VVWGAEGALGRGGGRGRAFFSSSRTRGGGRRGTKARPPGYEKAGGKPEPSGPTKGKALEALKKEAV